jgi:hypothetical protein
VRALDSQHAFVTSEAMQRAQISVTNGHTKYNLPALKNRAQNGGMKSNMQLQLISKGKRLGSAEIRRQLT